MRRITLAAMLAVGGLLATSSVASADIGDIDEFSLDQELTGTASTVDVSGQIRCTTEIDYGLIVGVAQDPPSPEVFFSDPESGEHLNASVEGVGAYGPNQGNEDNTPCSQSLQSWDVTVQQNRDSGDFEDGSMGVVASAGTSAENGDRGPGPFIGDLVHTADNVQFERVR